MTGNTTGTLPSNISHDNFIKLDIFWRFQGVQKQSIDIKWANNNFEALLSEAVFWPTSSVSVCQ